jgi:DAK2 domain fusion protein YloV
VNVPDVLDATVARRWCRLAADALGRTRGEIDAINVFPVPDGDTGTNLHLTMLAAAEALDGLPDGADTDATWRALAQGALLGARGNSGVILSQMFRGLSDVLGKAETADGTVLVRALDHAAALARSAVAHPVEGTILNVLDAASAEDTAGPHTTLAAAALAAAEQARAALDRTTQQLEVLAGNGVVDAGGAGLCVVLDVLAAVVTEEFPERYLVPSRVQGRAEPYAATADAAVVDAAVNAVGGAYEVMYLLDAADEAVPALREALDRLGDSLVVVGGDGLWNVHVHLDDAGAAIEAGLAAGRPYRIRVTYLRTESRTHARATGRGVVAVAVGAGLAALFESCGARVVTCEPGSVPPLALLLDGIVQAGAEVVLLPNEPEMISVAEAAASQAREHGVHVAVVPTEASVQGLAALAVHDPVRRFDADVIAMTHAAGATRHGLLEVAAAESVTSVGICQAGDVLGLIDGDVNVIGADLPAVARQVLDRMLSGGGELVTLISGAGAPPGLVEGLEGYLYAGHHGIEMGVYEGGQDRYPLLIGVE